MLRLPELRNGSLRSPGTSRAWSQSNAGDLATSLDLQVDRTLSLGEAHEIASRLEAAIRGDFGQEIEVETHIEPMETGGIAGRDAPTELQTVIAATMRKLLPAGEPIRDVH